MMKLILENIYRAFGQKEETRVNKEKYIIT